MDNPTRILIVEDMAADADLATRLLRKILKDCEVQVVETRKEFLKALEVFQPDVILSDYSLPHFDGMKALNLALKHAPLTPLIIWTGSISEDVAVACMKAGANNYVLKENFRRLGPAVIHALEERELLMARRQAEARINDLLAFNEKILNHTPLGILTYKLTGECVYANENAATIVGTRVEELQAQNFHTLDSWKKSGLYDLVQKAITTQAPARSDVHHVSTFGKDLWLTVHCVTFKSKDEDHLLLSLSDITERTQAEKALRESENRLILALYGAQMSVWEWDLQSNQILWSPEFFEITGLREAEFDGTFESFTHLIHSNDVDRVIASARKTMNERTLFAEEFRITRPDGEIRWLSNLGQAEYDSTGNHLRLIGTVQDITQRKQAEIERQALLEIMQGFANTKDLKELLKLIHHSIARVIPAENFFVVLYHPNSGLFEEIYSVDRYDLPEPPAKLEKSITSYVFRSGEPLLLTQARFEELAARNEVKLIGTNSASWLGVPLKTLGGTIGVMAVQDYESDNRYSEHDKDFMVSIATQVASAIERKQAEELLRQSEERFGSAFEYAVIGMALVTPAGQWFRVNRALCDLTGYSTTELLSKTFQDITHPDDLESDLNYLHQLLMGEINSYQMEKRYFHRLGHVVWVLLSVSLVRDDEGKPLYFISQIQDITERKRAEAELKRSHSLLYATLESTADGILVVEQNGKISNFNQKFMELWKIPYDLSAQPDDRFLLEFVLNQLKDPSAFLSKVDGLYQSPEAISFDELEFLDGRVFERFSQPQKLDNIIVGRVWSFRDITERKRAETELRASEERFRQLADNIQEVFWMTDTESGREIYKSPAAEEIWGRPIETLLHEPNAFINSVFPEDRPDVLRAVERERNGENVEMEYRIMRPDGSLRWVWDRAFPIFNDSGKVKRIAGISADITERREAELALIKSQSRYRELFDSSPISIWEEDFSLVKKQIDGLLESGVTDLSEYLSGHPDAVNELAALVKITDVNKASLELYRVEEKEQLLKMMTRALGRENLGHFQEEILGLLSPLKRFTWEGTEKSLDDRQIEVIVTGSMPHEYAEDWSKVIVSISDITERKQAEKALLRREQQLEEAQRLGLIGSWEADIQTGATTWSNEMYQLYDRDPQLPPFNLEEYTTRIHPDDQERITQVLLQAFQTRQSFNSDYRIPMANGKIRWMHTRGEIVVDADQGIRMRGITQDITQRKQSEMEIRRHLAELQALYENGLAVGRLLKPAEIGNKVIETFARYLPWHHVTIRLRREGSDDLELVAFNLPNLRNEQRAEAEQHFIARVNKVKQGLSGWVIQTGIPLRTGNVHAHSQYISSHAGIQSGLYVPLKAGEQVIGVISVESEAPEAFTEQDERLLETLASQAAIAFENARLYEAIQQELSERKRVEAALRSSETHYRELADSITDILFETDQDLHYTHWNKASEVFSGIPAEYAIGKSMQELFEASEEQSKREEIYKSILKEQQARTFETQLVVKGQKRTLEINAYPSTRGVSVVAKDVTERKRTETIMQKRLELMEYSASHTLNELLQRTVDEVSGLTSSSIGFFHFVEADQTTLGAQTWSTNALQLFDVSVSEGAHLPLDQAGVWAEAARQRRSLIHNDYGSLHQRKGLPQGHVPILREIVIPVLRNERIMAMMGVANKPQEYTQYDLEIAERLADYAWDIIERKQMAVALEVERNQLARRVEERTADLSRVNASLARALRVKDEFLANMSHELRTPLNAILGLSESLGEQIAGPLNEKQQKYITTIGESGHHLLSLINDILDLAKIEAGQITLDINQVDIRSVCQASLRMVKQLAQKKNQEVSLAIDEGLGLMQADERRLKQMIVNLLGNAVKFTPENGKFGLEVHGDQAANKIMITVWDHGIGIRQGDLARLFQPFVQLDSGLAREATGTGLGLALVAQMARLHGGNVSAESEPEKGSRFTIVLPWEPALTVQTSARLRNTGKLPALKFDSTKKPTILLVEDTQDVIMMIQDYLELAGYKVVTAHDGVEALAQARLVRPDLILMDIQLPHMDGLEATRKLRCEPDFRYTPIIALTALAMPDDRERCLAAGMDEYISKPIHLKALARVIQSCLFNHEESQPG